MGFGHAIDLEGRRVQNIIFAPKFSAAERPDAEKTLAANGVVGWEWSEAEWEMEPPFGRHAL